MPDSPDLRALPPGPSGADGELPPALAARLRALPAPDPGDAYFAALPARAHARLAAAPGAPSTRTAADRVPRARTNAPPRRLWAAAAVAGLVLAALALWTLTPPRPAAPRIAQQPPALPDTLPPLPPADPAPTAPAATPSSDVPRPDGPAGPAALPAARPAARPGTRPESRRTDRPSRLRPAPAPPPRAPTPSSGPVRSQRLAAAPGGAPDAALTAARLADSANVEGVRLLRRAQLVALALQNAERPSDVSVLTPLAASLADGLARWRRVPGADAALVASADVLEPVVVGLSLLAPADTASARTLRDTARRADLSLQLDRALVAAGQIRAGAY